MNFISGAVAGVLARSLTSPFDVVKILSQVGVSETKHGIARSFAMIYSDHGSKAFWRGNAVACCRLFPHNGLLFALYNHLKLRWSDPSNGMLSSPKSFLAGGLAGMCSTIAVYPLDIAKTRITIDRGDPAIVKYKTLPNALRTIVREEGWVALYKGSLVSMVGMIPFAGTLFMTYELFEYTWGRQKQHMGPLQHFIDGALAASVAQTISFPFDTIRKKIQAQSPTSRPEIRPDIEFEGSIDAFRQTVRKHGILGLWRGQTANLLKVAPFAGLMFAIYEQIRLVCMWDNGYIETPFRDLPRPGVNQFVPPYTLKEMYEEQWRTTKSIGVGGGPTTPPAPTTPSPGGT